MSKPMIVLQSDFFLSWDAVCEMKGIIKSVDRELEIIDECHEVRKYDAFEASLALMTIESF